MREIDVAIIGDIAWNRDITPQRQSVSPGGAVYYSAVGAARFSENIGAVAKVGEDFDLSLLLRRKIDISGIKVVPGGQTCQFVLTQYRDNTRDFEAQRNVAATVETGILPNTYLSARYIHLPTQLPTHSLTWLDFLANHQGVSVDSFEPFVAQYPELTREMFRRASMIFTNEAEIQTLRQFGDIAFDKPVIIKRGKDGAFYSNGEETLMVPAPNTKAIETSGAGDVLAGAFLAQRAQGIPVRAALEEAVRVASLSVTEFGVEHVPTKEFMDKKPEVVTAILILNDKGEIFLGKARKFNNTWIVPGGHFEEDETPEQCALREAKEEVGVEVSNLKLLKTHESFAPEYKGKGARFLCHNFVAHMTGRDVTLAKDEYTNYLFVTPEDALTLPDLHPTARTIIGYYLEASR